MRCSKTSIKEAAAAEKLGKASFFFFLLRSGLRKKFASTALHSVLSDLRNPLLQFEG